MAQQVTQAETNFQPVVETLLADRTENRWEASHTKLTKNVLQIMFFQYSV